MSSGGKVIYSQSKLKIYIKLSLIERKENDKIMRLAHISSLNFNEKNANVYRDFSLITTDPMIIEEVKKSLTLLRTHLSLSHSIIY